MKQVLTIAGSDSGGGAGIQADLKTMSNFSVYGASAITAVTAQNTKGVQGVEVLASDFVGKQIDSVASDLNFSAVKTGMLANGEIVKVVANKLVEYDFKNLVVDPVMVATSGDVLLAKEAIDILKKDLLPLAKVITPNLNEAKLLTGRNIKDEVSLEKLAKELYQFGAEYILVKGGHSSEKQAKDLLFTGKKLIEFSAPRLNTADLHGTGCTLSAAIASNLALGHSVNQAVKISKDFITEAIRQGVKIGAGNNPVNHLLTTSNR